MKICSKCSIKKDSFEFYRDAEHVCKECKKEARKLHYPYKEKTRKEVLSYRSPPIRRVLLDTTPKDDAAGDGPETS